MNKILTSIFVICLSIGVMLNEAHALFKSAKVTLVVVDENGQPLEGVDAGVAFEKNTGLGTDVYPQNKLTDEQGRATFSGLCNGHFAYGSEQDGYYPSHYEYDFKDLGTFGWEPWNPELEIVIRKIENPVPMYVRDTEKYKKHIAIPVVGKKVGFDLIAYDWVPPYGNGENADFVFYLEKNYKNMSDYSGKLTISFSNMNDGIIKIVERKNEGSTFKLLRFAPEEGYESEILVETKQGPNQPWISGFNSSDNYIFRIRTEFADGKIVSATYGKIIGPIILEPRRDPARVYFKYYLNPSNTTNLEHDLSLNLFRE